MTLRLFSAIAGMALCLAAVPAAADECHPDPDPAIPQYTLGYGSLM